MSPRLALIALCFTACGPADQLDASTAAVVVSSSAVQGGPDCPATWQEARARCSASASCTTLDTKCWYPGVGDQLPNGQWAPGLLLCSDLSGGTNDAGVGEWLCAQ